ncbi:MAG TPA: SdrD B-like domain-containing protein [Thermoanaerobaculia bacterium]|nr:SdrD B-like domain-containing protein [Thermoanaerobaculia bacterium]
MNRVRLAVNAIGLLLFAVGARAQLSGVVTTVTAAGAPQDVFTAKGDVFFTAGPTATPCAFTRFLSDGRYYFQVTDISGRRLLSTDPAAERVVTVRNGVLFSYDGHTHAADAAQGTGGEEGAEFVALGPCGGLSVGLAPFSDAGNLDASYLLWLTPLAAFSGDPAQIDAVCGTGCFHGFRPESSLTASFRVEDKRFCDDTFCVAGTKFEDRNGNGQRDSDESGLAGVVIRVSDFDDEDRAPLGGLTGADGAFRVCGLTSGKDFRVTEAIPFGYQQTAPADRRFSRRLIARDHGYIVEACDENFSGLDFGNQLIPNAIGGIKFEDLNANGVRDPGEPGLAGFTIALNSTTPGAPPVQSAVTDANGNFLFLNVAPGSYTLSETQRQGFSLTVPATNSIPVTLASGGSSIANEFGNFRGVLTGTISGSKFLDVNGNGARDPGEPGLAGVTITRTASINDPAGASLSVVTDAQGNFTFPAVPFGNFTLTETVPAGFVQTFPAPPGTASANVNFAQRDVTGLLFGNRAIAQMISGTKFGDTNGNGVRDAGEVGLAGVTIRLTDAAGTVRTTTTDASGNFAFTGVAAGTYTVSEVVPAGFRQTAPPAPGTFTATVTQTQGVSGLLFGNETIPTGAGTVTGRKILDINANGVFDGLDRGFEGIVFELRDQSGNLIASTTSDAQGNFTFSNVPAGTYVLSEILPENFFQTFPGTPEAPATYTVTVAPGGSATGFLFLNKC